MKNQIFYGIFPKTLRFWPSKSRKISVLENFIALGIKKPRLHFVDAGVYY